MIAGNNTIHASVFAQSSLGDLDTLLRNISAVREPRYLDNI